jgi:hypothetical protein
MNQQPKPADEIAALLEPQVRLVLEGIAPAWRALPADRAVLALERQVRSELAEWFALGPDDVAAVLEKIPFRRRPEQRREALLWLASFCIVLLANGLEREFLDAADGAW